MVFWLVVAGVVAVALLGGWLIDHNAAKRGYRIHVRQTGIRKHVTFEPIRSEPGAGHREHDDPH